ncbi:cytochrome P450 71A8-like [Olea europaea var. sylvestris]|uniref:cytochrome P450 71A8-like n=1 Tax=Olea europaea var. sylvestris TaxID=158386 RepID=UPI000C1CED8C|nr:cytochrome P450 71A8-like [Olea europaea var. sylvestris]
MDELMIRYALFFSSLTLFFVSFLTKKVIVPNIARKNFPPSPPKLPIIGNLHQLGSLPHRSLRLLAQKHGPLMFHHFGSTPVLVVSSADAARECMKTHELDFADRPRVDIVKQIFYNMKSLISSPCGEYWRQLKTILVHQLLSYKRVQSFNVIRYEEIALQMNKTKESSLSLSPVNLSKMFTSLTSDVFCRSAFGRKHSENELGKKFLMAIAEGQKMLINLSIGEFVPWLSWTNRLSGFNYRIGKVVKQMDESLNELIQEHLDNGLKTSRGEEAKDETNREYFLDVLLNIYNDNIAGASIDMDGIKALIKDIFGAGTETTMIVLKWAMTELLRHPKKVVIKETLRYHPPVGLIPREVRQDVKIMGYDIGAGTVVIINVWAIGRDPAYWDDPEKFEPDRFFNSSVDFKGLHYQFIPFGGGRRICPGIGFAMETVKLVLANLVHKFDWELPDGAKGEDIDMSEVRALTVPRKNPLIAVATPCYF